MKATCGDETCGRDWVLQKSPEQYSEGGPRCPDCGNRDVEIEDDGAAESVEARAFRRFRSGDGPLSLVEDSLCGVDEARRLAADFDELSEYRVVPEAELAEHVETARNEAEAEANKRVQQVRQQAAERVEEAEREINRLEKEVRDLRAEVDAEWQAAVRETTEVVEAECEERIEDAREEERAAAMARAEERLDEIRETAGATIGDLQTELDRERLANEHLSELVRALRTGDLAAVYAAGHRDGSRSPAVAEAARSDGALSAVRALVR